MFKRIPFILVILYLSAGSALGVTPPKYDSVNSRDLSPCMLEDLNSAAPVPDGIIRQSAPLNTDDPIGDIFLFGQTWNDIQHNASCARQVQVDNAGWVHVAWMNGLNTGTSLRHIYYQLMDTDDLLRFPGGVQVDQSTKSGYCGLELYPDNRALPAFHQLSAGSALYHSAMAFDYFPQTGAFSSLDLPWVYDQGVDLKVEWPHMDCDINGDFHIVSTHNPPDGSPLGGLHDIYYCKAEYDPLNFTIDYHDQFGVEQQEFFNYVTVVSSEVACSPVSNRTAIGWLQWAATEPDTTQYDNDLVYVVSEDGISFDWADTINVTNFIPPDFELLPDTIAANKDTLRVYPDISLIYDYNDVLHAFFTTRAYFASSGTISVGNSFIWHWDEEQQVFSLVATGWFENGFYDPGAWNTYVSRAQAAIDETTGDIYCMYQRYFQPDSSGHHPFLIGDTTDFSFAGWPNGEIWMTKSDDNGYSWTQGINVTNTHTPDAAPGFCGSELTPSMAPEVVNDYCHIFYIVDKDAGAVNQTEGTWTLNDAVYHRVPTIAIPDGPILDPYPLHIDSTGYPYPVSVAPSGDLNPAGFALGQNYPNPFNPVTSIRYSLSREAYMTLKVFDIQGREAGSVFEGVQQAGSHQAAFDASDLASGIYFYRLNAEGYSVTRKMILMK